MSKRYFVTVFVGGRQVDNYYSKALEELMVTSALYKGCEIHAFDFFEHRMLSGSEIADAIAHSRDGFIADKNRRNESPPQKKNNTVASVRRDRRKGQSKYWCVPVRVPERNLTFKTIKDCSRYLGIPYMTIKNCIIRGNATRGMHFFNANENVIMYIARDDDGTLRGFVNMPVRQDEQGKWQSKDGCDVFSLDNRLFPKITWRDRPVKVRISIEKN